MDFFKKTHIEPDRRLSDERIRRNAIRSFVQDVLLHAARDDKRIALRVRAADFVLRQYDDLDCETQKIFAAQNKLSESGASTLFSALRCWLAPILNPPCSEPKVEVPQHGSETVL